MNFTMIDAIVQTIGILYLITAFAILFYKKTHRLTSVLLIISHLNLVFLAFCYMKGKSFAIGQFWEYTIQFMMPVLLWLWVQEKINVRKFILICKICIALSFTCHGLYAVGFYPVPGNFIDMTISITGLSQNHSYIYLLVAGILDFILAIGIFSPNRKIVLGLLAYATFWGIATSLARIFAYVRLDYFWDPFMQWIPHTIYRLPHGLLPFVTFIMIYQYASKSQKNMDEPNLKLAKE